MADQLIGMKVNIGADSSKFRKGLTDAQKGMATFKDEAGSAFDSFASAFGVNMSALRDSVGSFKSAILGLTKASTTSAAGAGVLSKALRVLKVAMISTGIGALIVALGSLVAYFTKTERGADKLALVMAGFKAVIDVLIDRFSKFGEGVFYIFTGKFKQGWDALKTSVSGIGKEMVSEVKTAVSLEKALDDLYDRETALKEIQAKRNLEVAKLRQQSENQSISETKRAEMLRQAMALEKKTLEENLEIQREKARIETEKVGMSESMAEDERGAAEERAKLAQMEADMINSTRRLYTKEQGLSAKAAKDVADATDEQTKSYRELREEEQKLFDQQIALRKQMIAPIQQQRYSSADTTSLAPMTFMSDETREGLYTQLDEMKGVVIDISSEINNAMNGMAVGFGEAIGNMISGAEGFNNIGAAIVGPLADMAITVGKIAIGAGIAVLGIKKAFESINPFAAIAAGIALVALGTAVKGALANAAKGSSTASASVSGGSYVGNGFMTDTNAYKSKDPLQVQVIGETVIRNKDIYIAFKTAENNRKINT